MKVSDVIKLPVKVETRMKGSENDGLFLIAQDGQLLSECFNYGSISHDTIAHCLNTYDNRTDLMQRLLNAVVDIEATDEDWVGVYTDLIAEAQKELE